MHRTAEVAVRYSTSGSMYSHVFSPASVPEGFGGQGFVLSLAKQPASRGQRQFLEHLEGKQAKLRDSSASYHHAM